MIPLIVYLIASTIGLSIWLLIDRMRFRRRLRQSLLLRELYARGQWELRNGYGHEAARWFYMLNRSRSKLWSEKAKVKYIN